jgi:copper transport protein
MGCTIIFAMRFLIRLTLPVLLVLLAFSVQPAQAHGYIVRAIPEDRAVLERPPARLQYWFSEGLEPGFSTITLRDQTGAALAEGSVSPDNNALLTLQVPPDLPDGAYVVDLRPAFASDGHVVAETRVFFVGEEVGGVAGSQSSYAVIPLEVLWRTLLYASTLLLFGAAVLYAHTLLPAWGNPEHRAGWLPPRVMRRHNWIFGAALVAALAGNMIAIAQQSMAFFNTGLTEVVTQGLWQVVRIGSRFGDVWTARMILLALAAALFGLSIRWRDERPETVRAFWNANVWVGALLVGAFSVTSHAAGSLILPWVAVFVDWAHTLAVGAWVGGLAALALVLPVALRPYSGDDQRQALLIVLRRFSRLALVALAVVAATGVYSALNWLYQPADLTQTGWGLSLLVKLALVGSLLLIALPHHLAANPERFRRWRARLPLNINLTRTLRLEALLALAVLVSVAYLAASAVPEPVFLTEGATAPQAAAVTGDLSVHVTISPGGPGVNTYDVVIEQNGQPLGDLPVQMQMVNPARDWRSDWSELAPAGPGLYVTSGDSIDREGGWWMLLDITLSDRETRRAAYDWDISAEVAVPTSIEPGPLNWLALAGVLVALGWAAYPAAYRLYTWLDWHPVSIAAAVSAIIATILLTALAIRAVNQSAADYEATINPPPQMVNTVLPDADSLASGAALFEQHCRWPPETSSYRALIERLPRTRDEDLFFAIRDGWRDLPPCANKVTDEQHWHIVNYIRSLA